MQRVKCRKKDGESKIELVYFFIVFMNKGLQYKKKTGTKLQGARDEIGWGWAIGVDRWKG